MMKARNDDSMFWDRIHDMPAWEAEQECVMRRESLSLENAMLQSERAKLSPPIGRSRKVEFDAIGVAMAENNALLARLYERIKYLRKLQDKIHWKESVRVLFGDDAVSQCLEHMELQWRDVFDGRREMAK